VVYDAIDDCTRLITTRAYKERNMKNSIAFVKHILARTNFTIRAIRTDN
jgi:transposase-like protein